MNKDWILQTKETRRKFSNSTWIPLRAICEEEKGDVTQIGYICEFFGCGSVAFPPENRKTAEELSWGEIGIIHDAMPYAYEDGYYSPIEQYQYNDKEPIGIHLIFDHPQPVIGGRKWIINPDLIAALGLIQEGNNWVRPQEDFAVVIKEEFDSNGSHKRIDIKKEFLLDYLAARNLSLRLSYYRQRVENIENLENSEYSDLKNLNEERDSGRFEVRILNLNDVYGGGWASFRVWRTDIDEEEDAPVLGEENNENTDCESKQGYKEDYQGIRVESEFWRDEWIDHQNHSIRIRRDVDLNLPSFIVDTDGTRMPSKELDNEDIGRWLWFRSNIINELLSKRGFTLEWCTQETGLIHSTSGYKIHFGLNSADLITVYAYDIARLNSWEQHLWAAQNVSPDGKVSAELLSAQVRTEVADTIAPEMLLFKFMNMLETSFNQKFGIELYIREIDFVEYNKKISRFISRDLNSLLQLAKELIRIFSERLNKSELQKISTHKNKKDLGTNKLLESIVAQEIGEDKARKIFSIIAGTYDMRLGDAHPTSSKIDSALNLANIDKDKSFLRQGKQLIHNFSYALCMIGRVLFNNKP